jgi:hypothetical protein
LHEDTCGAVYEAVDVDDVDDGAGTGWPSLLMLHNAAPAVVAAAAMMIGCRKASRAG